VHGEGGQATVEWVALVLAAALVLGAAAALAGREADRGLGEEFAKRISRTVSGVGRAPAVAVNSPTGRSPTSATSTVGPGAAAPPPSPRAAPPSTRAAPPPTRAAPPPASGPRAVQAFRRLRGVADVARHTWIGCLGYRRWRYELEHPMAPTEALPLDEALDIVNTCFNPYDYLLEEE
jgi:hypothetical protein